MFMADNRPPLGRFNFSGVVPSNILASLAISIACPYIFYQFLMQHNVAIFTSLSISAIFPLVFVILFLSRQRTLDLIGLVALLWIAFLVLSSFITPSLGDFRLITLLRILPIGLIGVVFLLSQFSPRPCFFFVDRYLCTNNQPEQITIYQQDWQANRRYQRMIKILNGIWGIGLLMDFLLVAVLFFVFAFTHASFIISLVIIGIPAILLVLSAQYKSTIEQKEEQQQEEQIADEE
jgi:hypothetical protein